MRNNLNLIQTLFFLVLTACNASKVAIDTSGLVFKNKQLVNFSNIEMNEGDSVLVYFTLSTPATEDLTIQWTISGVAPSADFVTITNTIVIPAGDDTGNFNISSLNDVIYDLDRDYDLTLKFPSSGKAWTKSLKLKDNESVPVIQFSSASQNLLESLVSPTVGYTMSPASKFPVTVNYLVSGTSSGAGVDHSMSDNSIVIPALSTSGNLSLSLNDDIIAEGNETLILTLGSVVGGGVVGATNVHTITLIDDEGVNLSVNDVTVSEGGTATFTVSLSSIPVSPVTFDWATADGTGNSTSDYFSGSATGVTITPPATSATITVNTRDDAVVCEGSKTFSVVISNVASALVADDTGVGTITDPDLPTVSFALASSSVSEGSVAAVAVNLSAACATHDVTFTATSVNGTATAADYTAIPGSTFTILQNTTSVNVNLTTTQDLLYENNETLSLMMSTPPMGATLGAQTSHTLTITNEDAKPTLSVADVSLAEGSGTGTTTAAMTISLSAVSGLVTTVNYATSNGTATTADGDYTATSGTATIAAGAISTTVNITVGKDTKDEWDETVNFTLSGGNGNYESVGADLLGILTIQNDDVPPAISLSPSVAVDEGATLTFTASLSAVSGKEISFDFNTSDVSATGGADYTSVSGTYTIGAGGTTKSIVIPSAADAVNCELSETFTSGISNLVNVTAGSPLSVTGTINDYPYYSIDNQTVMEGGTALFTVTSSIACPTNLDVGYSAIANSAYPGLDYIHESGTVTVLANTTTAILDIVTLDDSAVELPENLFVNIRPVMGYSSVAAGVLTIEDDEAGSSVAKVRMGPDRACAISTSHELKCWGRVGDGKGFMPEISIGNNSGEMGANLIPVNLGAGRTPVKVLSSAPSTSAGFSCALLDNSDLKCWGSGQYGKLGQEDTLDRGASPLDLGDNLLPINLGTGLNAVDFCLGPEYVCTLLNNGDVKCFGDGGGYALGNGSTATKGDEPGEMGDALVKVNLGAGKMASKIACGLEHNCAILTDGTVKCWGNGLSGRLGNESASNISGASVIPVVNLGTGVTPLDISIGTSNNCVILDHAGVNKIKCWGTNGNGKLGLGHTSSVGGSVGDMGDNLPFLNFNAPEEPVELSLSYANGCAKFDNGKWKCWGIGSTMGLSGDWGNDDSHDPDGAGPLTEIAALPYLSIGTSDILKLSPSVGSGCALLDDAGVKKISCWGTGVNGQLGNGDSSSKTFTTQIPIDLGLPVLDFAAQAGSTHTFYHACAIVSNAGTPEVRCWGSNSAGQLGNAKGIIGDEVGELSALAAIDPGTDGINPLEPIDIAMTSTHDCLLMKNGSVKCMGIGGHGQLGLGGFASHGGRPEETLANQPMVNLGGAAIAISVIDYASCALLDNLTIKCWGIGSYVGVGQASSSNTPRLVSLGINRKAIKLQGGRDRMCYLLDNGDTKCFGRHDLSIGQLGKNLTSGTWGDSLAEAGDNFTPINFGADGFSNPYSVISLGEQSLSQHSCVLFNDGKVKCWGQNANGQLGIGSTSNKGFTDTDIAELAPISLGENTSHIVSGGNHTCSLLVSGNIKCWGGNAFGQLGYGDILSRGHTTSSMSGVTNLDLGPGITAVDVTAKGSLADFSSTCAILNTGELKCWGYNSHGELGAGHLDRQGHTGATIPSLLPAVDLGW